MAAPGIGETGCSPSSVPIHLTLGSSSVFSSVKCVHAKVISKLPLLLMFDGALIVRSLNLKEVPLGEKKGNDNLYIYNV